MASSTRNVKEAAGERGEGSREECWEAIFCDINALYARLFVGGFVFTEIALSARAYAHDVTWFQHLVKEADSNETLSGQCDTRVGRKYETERQQ